MTRMLIRTHSLLLYTCAHSMIYDTSVQYCSMCLNKVRLLHNLSDGFSLFGDLIHEIIQIQ
jgi:hypothetical protein